jgi:type II secretion system protein H
MALMELLAVKVKTKTLTAGNRGFTLFELLLVLFIIGLAASVVMVSGSRMQEKTLFNTEARKLYLTVKHAREMSMVERRDIVFKVDAEAGNYWIAYGDDKTSEKHSLPQKFSIAGEDVIFFPKGNSSGGRIEISNGKDQKYEVSVDQVLGTTSIKRL